MTAAEDTHEHFDPEKKELSQEMQFLTRSTSFTRLRVVDPQWQGNADRF